MIKITLNLLLTFVKKWILCLFDQYNNFASDINYEFVIKCGI